MAGSGVFLPDLSRALYNNSITGGEFLLGIPGSVGGDRMQVVGVVKSQSV